MKVTFPGTRTGARSRETSYLTSRQSALFIGWPCDKGVSLVLIAANAILANTVSITQSLCFVCLIQNI